MSPSSGQKSTSIREWLGVKYRDYIGTDNIMFGTDFPHIGSFYPHSRFHFDLVLCKACQPKSRKRRSGAMPLRSRRRVAPV